jgi:TolA-binding protein
LLPGEEPGKPQDQGEFLEQQEDPKFKELDQRQRDLDARQAKMDEFIQKQQYQQQVSTYETQIDKQVQAVIGKYGDAVDVQDLMQRMLIQINSGQPFDAEAAFSEQKATFQRLYQKQASGRPAPNIIPTNGTPAPSGEVKPENMNEDQRKAYFKHLLDVANSGG